MALFIPTIIATGIYAGIINTISSATVNTCFIIKNIYNYQNPDTNIFLRKLDIERRLCLIQSLIKNINIPQNSTCDINIDDINQSQLFTMIGSQQNININPLSLCLRFIQETIQNINNILYKLDVKIKKHHAKWFNSWRVLNVKTLLDELEIQSQLLTNRFDDLTKISMVISYNQSNL